MAVNDLKCSECDNVTTDVCPQCGTTPLCATCKDAVKLCAECDPGELEDDEEEEGDEYDDLDDLYDEGDEDDGVDDEEDDDDAA